jgi:hypothetical protein
LPDVKAGSIIEYKYKWHIGYSNWYFQNQLPTRYSEIETELPKSTSFGKIKVIPHVKQSYVIDIGTPDDIKQIKALANIQSLTNEPYMSAREDNLQRMEFLGILTMLDSWKKIGKILVRVDDFGGQFDRVIANEGGIIKQAKSIKSEDEKIAFIFNTVKNSMKWNEH